MEPVKGGALADVPEKARQIFSGMHPDMSPASWAIRFAASLEGVMMVFSGMSDMAQLADNTGYMRQFAPLSPDELKAVNRAVGIINEATAIPCTACGYCTDVCPKSIAIPKYFALYNTEKQAQPKGFSLQKVYYGNYTETFGKASDCIGCRSCEGACPQHIEITNWLKEVTRTFE
jgi:predicted aldo/keto reductase-like oxidoreductase